jgi:transposase-like protein
MVMTIQEQILTLFNQLAEPEKSILLQELRHSDSKALLLQDNNMPIQSCPHCNSSLFVKNGKRQGLQRYKCKSCCKIFTFKSGTALHKLKKTDKFETYKSLMLESYLPLKKIAFKVGISFQTAFDWRHKILSGLNKSDTKFDGITEIDDIWFLYSQKGRKGLKYSRKRGGRKQAGDNAFQAKLLVTTDRKNTMDMSLVRIGRLRKSDIQRKISGRFSNNSVLVSDKHRSIASFASSEGIKHINFKASKHTAGSEYHVQGINNLASKLKATINHSLRGVSTKYLQSYANWVKLVSSKVPQMELDNMLLNDSKASEMHKNREGVYKWFLENFSERTYRCPVKRTFASKLAPELIPVMCNV